jgi:hypothetical protein
MKTPKILFHSIFNNNNNNNKTNYYSIQKDAIKEELSFK